MWLRIRDIKELFFVKKGLFVTGSWPIIGSTGSWVWRSGIKHHSPRWSLIHLADLEERKSKTTSYFYHHGKCCSRKGSSLYFNNEFIHYLFSIDDWCQIHPNLNPQSAIKPDMKMELRMKGAVNGHQFVITGEGRGQPFE